MLDDPAGVLDQVQQEPVLGGTELDVLPASDDLAPREVNRKICVNHQRFFRLSLRRLHSAQHGAEAARELARAERLGNIVVGPQVETSNPVFLISLDRQHDDRNG